MDRTFLAMTVTASLLLAGCAAGTPATATPDAVAAEQLALETLTRFFDLLSDGNYLQAASLYGGSYDVVAGWNPDVDPTDHAGLLWNACTINGLQCLRVKSAVLQERVSDTEFRFQVEFANEDGSLFVLGPCCGTSEADQPSQSAFTYTVVKSGEGAFAVMEMPVYMP